jgi:phospholipid/cholesterol/gamma-HCH transport system ATP-binding protein
VILYDEPTTGLDPVRSDVINELILKLQREMDVTSIVVTHDMQSAFKVGNRIVMLHEGKLVFDGTPQEVQRSENPVVRNFVLGEASEQELAGLRRRPASAAAGSGPARGQAKKQGRGGE